MKTYTEIINEAQERKLSSGWTITWEDWHAPIAKEFLKKMDERATALNISQEMAEKAVKEFWMGNFPKALKTLWGNKVRSAREVANGGSIETYTYIIPKYGTFTETYEQSLNAYSHKIMFKSDDEEANCYDLNNVMACYCTRKGAGDFAQAVRQTEQQSYKLRSNHILNCLFVGFAGKDLGMTLTGIRRKNKIE